MTTVADPNLSSQHAPTAAQLTRLRSLETAEATARASYNTALASQATAQAASASAARAVVEYQGFIYCGKPMSNSADLTVIGPKTPTATQLTALATLKTAAATASATYTTAMATCEAAHDAWLNACRAASAYEAYIYGAPSTLLLGSVVDGGADAVF